MKMIRPLCDTSRTNILALVFTVFGVWLWSGCGPDYVYEQERVITAEGWAYADSLTFRPTIGDTLSLYDIELEVEHTTAFPFQNLYVQIHTRFPEGQRLSETVSLELADRAGNWYGDCGSDRCTLRIPLQEKAFFEQAGDYTFTIAQYTRRDPVPGVTGLSLSLRKAGERTASE